MSIFREIVKNVLPYYLVKQYQASGSRAPFAPGGYYSPIPAMADIQRHNFNAALPDEIPGIDLNTSEQMDLLHSFEKYYNELPFGDEKTNGLRYYYNNNFYSYSDAIFLYCMIRHLKPSKILEAGSGFSSSVTLDTNELFMGNTIQCFFIEPYPARLKSLLKEDDKTKAVIYEKKLQEIPLEIFSELSENDILFIDSTHVSKFNSDVNYVIHTILPKLAKGVYIHFHDIFYPFEYPELWLLGKKAWNEQYILRAFLEYNTNFKIVLFNTYLKWKFENELKKRFPLLYKKSMYKNNIDGSLWIKKI